MQDETLLLLFSDKCTPRLIRVLSRETGVCDDKSAPDPKRTITWVLTDNHSNLVFNEFIEQIFLGLRSIYESRQTYISNVPSDQWC
ncbi:MAG: hypothetical protein BMS9Abin33_0314 [Gammaproteobacteria bacterium]|nr:MAG: hypothetical protein BMS9Abin33_0314 [Gammaproteobacteria bacterium]